MSENLKIKSVKYDVVVVGGGLSGMCAAIAAARHGAKTALVHARHVLGGNASSEIRMHICGASENMMKPHLEEGAGKKGTSLRRVGIREEGPRCAPRPYLYGYA